MLACVCICLPMALLFVKTSKQHFRLFSFPYLRTGLFLLCDFQPFRNTEFVVLMLVTFYSLFIYIYNVREGPFYKKLLRKSTGSVPEKLK